MIKYSRDHEWVSVEGDIATVGITEFAQSQLGDVVFVELPEVGAHFDAHGQFAVVELVKAASDVYVPVAGTVVAVNADLSDNPAMVNEAAEGSGWFARFKLDDPKALDALMDADAYKAFVAESH